MTQTIPASLAILAKYFPNGFDASRLRLYEDDLNRREVDPVDVAEAIERIKVVHDSRSFPSIGKILQHSRESRVDRLKAKHEGPPQLDEGMVRYGSFQAREMAVWKSLAIRGTTFCDIRNCWLEDKHCDHDPICHGARVGLDEAFEKLSWALVNRAIDPRRASWQAGVSM